MTSQTYCIVGAAGFFGRHLSGRLTTIGNVRVRCLTRTRQATNDRASEWIIGDLHDEQLLRTLITQDAIVVNLAFDANASSQDCVAATRLLGRACVKTGAKRLIHISTAAVIGRNGDTTITEITPCNPFSSYERKKFEIEQALASEVHDILPTVILRPTAAFGIGGANLLTLARRTARNTPLLNACLAYINGARSMNLIAVENVIAAIVFLANMPLKSLLDVFIVSDDDDPHNHYAFVESILNTAFGNALVRSKTSYLSPKLLELLLKIRGRPNINPLRRYACDKLLASGFVKPVAFKDALSTYAHYLATQWKQQHKIFG